MIVKQELVKKIKDYFNLNIYETKVWLALLSQGIISAGETAELSGVPRSRTYDVLESLAKRGFAVIKVGKPVKYIAVEPKAVIEKMKLNILSHANDKVKSLSNLKVTPEYTELNQMFRTGITPIKPEEISGFIKGRPSVVTKIRELLESAEKEISIFTSVSDFEDKSRAIIPTLERLAKKNIKVKISLSGEEDKIRRLSSKNFLKIKKVENDGRFFIADKKQALFMISHDKADEEIGIWINAPFFSQSISNMVNLSS